MTKKDKEQNQAFYDWWESQKEADGHVHSPKMTYPKVIIDDRKNQQLKYKVNLNGSVITLVHNEVLHYCSIMTTKTMQILQEPIPLLQMFGFI
jgi:hypothetical protein